MTFGQVKSLHGEIRCAGEIFPAGVLRWLLPLRVEKLSTKLTDEGAEYMHSGGINERNT
jgi:hypothetical protein